MLTHSHKENEGMKGRRMRGVQRLGPLMSTPCSLVSRSYTLSHSLIGYTHHIP